MADNKTLNSLSTTIRKKDLQITNFMDEVARLKENLEAHNCSIESDNAPKEGKSKKKQDDLWQL